MELAGRAAILVGAIALSLFAPAQVMTILLTAIVYYLHDIAGASKSK